MNISALITIVGTSISQWRRLRRERKAEERAEQIEEIRLLTAECAMQREYFEQEKWERNGDKTIKDEIVR